MPRVHVSGIWVPHRTGGNARVLLVLWMLAHRRALPGQAGRPSCLHMHLKASHQGIKRRHLLAATLQFVNPEGVGQDADSNILVADSANHRRVSGACTGGRWIASCHP